MASVLEYVKDSKFFMDVVIGALSAIPRWKFARVLEAKAEDTYSPRLGNAMRAFYSSTCEILQGKNVLVEHILNREPECGVIRMALYGAIMRSYFYLAEKCDRSKAYVRLDVSGWRLELR